MAIAYKDIRKIVRFKEQDNNELRFSDYDIKMAVNEVIRYISNADALNNADFNEKQVTYDEDEYNEQLINGVVDEGTETQPSESEDETEEGAGDEELDSQAEDVEEVPERISFKLDGAELPEDFVALVSIRGRRTYSREILRPCLSGEIPRPWEYKIQGDRIYCGQKKFTLTYKAMLMEVKTEDDEIALPYMFTDTFVQLVRMVLNQTENDIMMDAVDTSVQQLIPKRRYRNAKIRMPFKIGGW